MRSEKEKWKAIDGFPEYEVSDCGRVRSYKKCLGVAQWEIADEFQRYLSPADHRGYLTVRLSNEGKGITFPIHRLVAMAFLGACPNGMEVCHINNKKQDNHVSNLKYDSRQANVREAVRDGLGRCLAPTKVSEIRHRRVAGESVASLADEYGVRAGTIYDITTGRRYVLAPGPTVNHAQLHSRRCAERRAKERRRRYFNQI